MQMARREFEKMKHEKDKNRVYQFLNDWQEMLDRRPLNLMDDTSNEKEYFKGMGFYDMDLPYHPDEIYIWRGWKSGHFPPTQGRRLHPWYIAKGYYERACLKEETFIEEAQAVFNDVSLS